MREIRTCFLWFTLLSLARSVISEKADCGDGLELNALQGVESTFSIPVKTPCSAALITFSDGTDLMLDLLANISCHDTDSEAQTFATVIGSNTPEGVATLTFQCSEQVYCMSINVADGKSSDSQTSIRTVCANLADPSPEHSGAAVITSDRPKVSNESMYGGGALATTRTFPEPVLASQNDFITSLEAGLLGNGTYATSLDSDRVSQSAFQTPSALPAGTTSTTSSTWTASPSRTSNVPVPQTSMVSLNRNGTTVPATTAAPPDDTDAIKSKTVTTLNGGDSTDTVNQIPSENQSREPHSSSVLTAQSFTAYAFQNGTIRSSSTQTASQDLSTCACYPLPTS